MIDSFPFPEYLKPSTTCAVINYIYSINLAYTKACNNKTTAFAEQYKIHCLTCALSRDLDMLQHHKEYYKFCTSRNTLHLYAVYLHILLTINSGHLNLICQFNWKFASTKSPKTVAYIEYFKLFLKNPFTFQLLHLCKVEYIVVRFGIVPFCFQWSRTKHSQ